MRKLAAPGRRYRVQAGYTNAFGVKGSFECRFRVPHDQRGHAGR